MNFVAIASLVGLGLSVIACGGGTVSDGGGTTTGALSGGTPVDGAEHEPAATPAYDDVQYACNAGGFNSFWRDSVNQARTEACRECFDSYGTGSRWCTFTCDVSDDGPTHRRRIASGTCPVAN